MRLVAVVVALVACVHAGCGHFPRKKSQRRTFTVRLRACPTASIPTRQVGISEIRSDLEHARAAYPGDPHLFVDQGPRNGPAARRPDRACASPRAPGLAAASTSASGRARAPTPPTARRYRERMADRARNTAEAQRGHRHRAQATPIIDGLVLANEAIYRGETILFDNETLSPEEVDLAARRRRCPRPKRPASRNGSMSAA